MKSLARWPKWSPLLFTLLFSLSGVPAPAQQGDGAEILPVVPCESRPAEGPSLADLQQRLAYLEGLLKEKSPPPESSSGVSRTGGILAGAEVFLAMPWFEDSVSLTVLTDNRNRRDVRTFNHHFDATPRVWLGYMNDDGIGIRARYFMYDQRLGQVSETDPGPQVELQSVLFSGSNITESIFRFFSLDGDTLNVNAGLRTHLVDLEGLIQLDVGGVDITASSGLRYALLEQHYTAQLVDAKGTAAETLSHALHYEGLGLTMGVQGRRSIVGNLSAFAGARISALYGRTNETSESVSVRTANKQFVREADELLAILEVPVGVEWSRSLASGGRVLVRGSVEGQIWANGGNLQSDVNSFSFLGLAVAVGFER